MEQSLYNAYLEILKEELVPAMGCTEPIAVAYAAALAARALGCPAEKAEVAASANIIKNVKSVVVPHTGGRRGIAAAAAAGIVAGDADKELEVLCGVTEKDLTKMADFLASTPIEVERSGKPYLFDIQVRLFGGGHTAYAEIAGHHTNVIALQRDGEVLVEKEYLEQTSTHATDHSLLNVCDQIERNALKSKHFKCDQNRSNRAVGHAAEYSCHSAGCTKRRGESHNLSRHTSKGRSYAKGRHDFASAEACPHSKCSKDHFPEESHVIRLSGLNSLLDQLRACAHVIRCSKKQCDHNDQSGTSHNPDVFVWEKFPI